MTITVKQKIERARDAVRRARAELLDAAETLGSVPGGDIESPLCESASELLHKLHANLAGPADLLGDSADRLRRRS